MFTGIETSTANVLLASTLSGIGALLILAIGAIANLRHRVAKIEGGLEAADITVSLETVNKRVNGVRDQVSEVSGQLKQQNERIGDLVSVNQTLIDTLLSRRAKE